MSCFFEKTQFLLSIVDNIHGEAALSREKCMVSDEIYFNDKFFEITIRIKIRIKNY